MVRGHNSRALGSLYRYRSVSKAQTRRVPFHPTIRPKELQNLEILNKKYIELIGDLKQFNKNQKSPVATQRQRQYTGEREKMLTIRRLPNRLR